MYQGKRVVTFAMIDEVHQRPKGTARRTFTKHKRHFIDGVDYFLLGKDVLRPYLDENIAKYTPELMVLAESGYLMLVKPFTDDLSWQVQRSMVNSYFRLSEFPELQHINIPTLAELEAMPIDEAQNLISRLEADSYQGHGRRGSYAMNLRRKEKKALKPMVIAIEQASQLHIQDMGDYHS
ncbi:ORF6N domain-containing protein [Proteus mirabilis]